MQIPNRKLRYSEKDQVIAFFLREADADTLSKFATVMPIYAAKLDLNSAGKETRN